MAPLVAAAPAKKSALLPAVAAGFGSSGWRFRRCSLRVDGFQVAAQTVEIREQRDGSHPGPAQFIAQLSERIRTDLDLRLEPKHHDRILYILAASWVPVEDALLHYGACEAMNLSESELDTIGRHVSQRIMGTFVGTIVRTASHVLMPNRVPLQQYPRLWERLMLGGSCGVYVCGAKDARIESRGVPMFRYRYFRIAYTGLIRGAGAMFRSSVQARNRNATDDSLTIELSWT